MTKIFLNVFAPLLVFQYLIFATFLNLEKISILVHYRVALHFCSSLFLRINDCLHFVGTNFAIVKDWFSCWVLIFAIFGKLPVINNYSPKWRWLAVDIYRASKQRGKYPTLATDTEVNSCFSIY